MNQDTIKIVTLGCVAVAMGASLRHLILVRRDPIKREFRRRSEVYQAGRVTEGTVLDWDDNCIHYLYTVNGVPYSTAQDISTLKSYVPADPNTMIGEVRVKYAHNNPANSIIVCESWSGLRSAHQNLKETEQK